MCDRKQIPMKKARVPTSPKFRLEQEVELLTDIGTAYKIHAITTTTDGTAYEIARDGVIRDGRVRDTEIQLFLPRAFFYLWVHRDGSLSDTMRDEDGYSAHGHRLSRPQEHLRLDFSKTELARINPPMKEDVEEDDDFDD